MNDKSSPVTSNETAENTAVGNAAATSGVAPSSAPAGAGGGSAGTGTAEAPVAARRVIKRYSNRKLYDTKDSRYVTLLQIAEMVRGGGDEEVQIIDNNTKEDLTEVTLAQIIYEEQKAHARSVPLQTLKELIHSRTEKVLTELREGPIGRLIPGARTDAGGDEAGKHEGHEGSAAGHTAGHSGAEDAAKHLVNQAKGTFEEWQHKVDDRVKAVLPNMLPWSELLSEVKRLRERVEELESQAKSKGGHDHEAKNHGNHS